MKLAILVLTIFGILALTQANSLQRVRRQSRIPNKPITPVDDFPTWQDLEEELSRTKRQSKIPSLPIPPAALVRSVRQSSIPHRPIPPRAAAEIDPDEDAPLVRKRRQSSIRQTALPHKPLPWSDDPDAPSDCSHPEYDGACQDGCFKKGYKHGYCFAHLCSCRHKVELFNDSKLN